MLSPIEQCRQRALADCDSRYTKFLVDQAAYALTGVWQGSAADNQLVGSDTEWPWQIDVWPTSIDVEKSRRLTDSNTARRSRHLGGKVEPKVLGVDRYTAEARRGFWCARHDGYGIDSGWEQHIGSMFDDFDLLGVGSCGVGLVRDPESGKQKVAVQHYKATDVLWERNVRHPANSRRVVRRKFIPLEEALVYFLGKRGCTLQHINDSCLETRDNPSGHLVRVVPVFEYWDIGLASFIEGKESKGVLCEPTRCVWIGSISGGPCVIHERNPFGCLPQAAMVNKLPPECRYPFGSVMLEMAANELATQGTVYLLSLLKKGPVDIWRKKHLDHKQLTNHKAGRGDGNLDITDATLEDMKSVLQREPGVQVTNALPLLMQLVDRRYDEAAKLSQADQGSFIDEDKTLGEFAQTQGEAATNRAFGKQQVELGLIRLFDRVFKVAERFDRAPVIVDVFGEDYFVNAPGDARNSCEMLFKDPGKNIVDQGALTATDALTQMVQGLKKLEPVQALAASGLVSQQKLAEETLKLIGYEPKDWEPTEIDQMRQAAQQVAQSPAA